MAAKRNKHEANAAKARLQMFEAKQELEFVKLARRNRDNRQAILWSLGAILVALVLQVVYFGVGPGKVTAAPTGSPSASNAPSQSPVANNVGDVPTKDLAESKTWNGSMTINGAKLDIQLDGKLAPRLQRAFFL